jgi:hypothetical protein
MFVTVALDCDTLARPGDKAGAPRPRPLTDLRSSLSDIGCWAKPLETSFESNYLGSNLFC